MATLRRCARLITNVLTRCRHKGAIESAGVTLGRLVQVASVSENRALPADILGQFLDSQMGGASVTRRSAGLAILVHRIVASDMQQGKPLVAMAVTRLISVASVPVGEADAELSDLPQAQALHFLRTLVQDASLRQNMAPFISRVAMLCFENFASPIWTIRNAALQLFGAVASKLVGQKKAHDDDVVGTLEELSAHFPTLLSFLLSRLQEALACPDLHPTLVPNLSFLSKMSLNHPYLTREYATDVIACTGPYINSCSLHESQGLISSLTQCLFQLLPSHVQAVRKLAAKAIANFTPFPLIEKLIISLIKTLTRVDSSLNNDQSFFITGSIGENQLNGLLLTLQYLTGRFLKESANMSSYSSSIDNITVALGNLRQLHFKSHYNLALALQLMNFTGLTSDIYSYDYCKSILCIIADGATSNESFKIGFYQWGSVEVELILRHCPDKELFDCFLKVLAQPRNFACDMLRIVKIRLSLDSFPVVDKLHMLSYSFSLLTAENVSFRPLPLLEIMLLLSSQNYSVTLPLQSLDLFYNRYVRDASCGWKCSAVGLSVVSNLLGSLIQATNLSPPDDILMFLIDITNSINVLCCPLSSDEDQRLNAAVSLSFLSYSLLGMLRCNAASRSTVWGSVFKTVLNSCVMLLQDENCDVRREAAKFTSQILKHDTKVSIPGSFQHQTCGVGLNPYICLHSLFSSHFLTFWLGEDHALPYLWLQLDYSQTLSEMYSKKGTTIVSPFDHGTSNVYAEYIQIVEWSVRTLEDFLKLKMTGKEILPVAFMDALNLKKPLLDKAWTCFSELASTNVVDPDCLYLVAKQLSSHIKVFELTDISYVSPPWTDELQEFLQHLGLVL